MSERDSVNKVTESACRGSNKALQPADAHGTDGNTSSIEAQEAINIGQWYWVKKVSKDSKTGETKISEWLGCVMHVGSNYVEIEGPSEHGSQSSRVHFNIFHERTRPESDAESVIRGKVANLQAEATGYLEEVKRITASLGVSPQEAIEASGGGSAGSSTALATLSKQVNVKDYENALKRAKQEQLPELFEKIKRTNDRMAKWMGASTLPMQAMTHRMKGVVGTIDDRIFNISLYAGLAESSLLVKDGEPAPFSEKLHVMQRRMYMDEECLVNYEAGGMEFKNIGEFDEWLCKSENLNRILPFPRCMVAMQVRRKVKDRSWDGTFLGVFVNIKADESDKFTYLYVRNGERVSCIASELEFDEKIFPDRDVFDVGEPMMVCIRTESRYRKNDLMPVREYDVLLAAEQERKIKRDKWEKGNPGIHWTHMPSELSYPIILPENWSPYNPSSVYFDDATAKIDREFKKYNRVAMIIQGLFDRSDVLHPHPPVKTWTPDGFAAAIDLVYDGSMTLHDGEAPDIDAYIERCNASIDENSVLIGQEYYWERREAKKECERRDNDYRYRDSSYRPETFRPYGNPGPGHLARPSKWMKRARSAVFTWYRERLREKWLHDDKYILCSIKVPASALFNASAYKPGDFRQFYTDPRTRAQYLKWAPMLLAAEDYHAGKREVQEPVE